MTGDTLQEFDRLVTAGFSEEQARALVEVVGAPARTDPDVLEILQLLVREVGEVKQRLNRIDGRLDGMGGRFDGVDGRLSIQGATIEAMTVETAGMRQGIADLSRDYRAIHEDQNVIRGDLHVVGERVKMEGRVARMINLALIAIGATAASLLAVFAR